MSHFKLPWEINKNTGEVHAEERMVASVYPVADTKENIVKNKANAAFIVKACNEHYKQKESNAKLLDALKHVRNCQTMSEISWVEIDEAIKQAEEE